MRTVFALALLAFAHAAHADERPQLQTKIGRCLRIPVEFQGHFRVVFQITLDSKTRASAVDVIEYEPKSEMTAKGAAKLATELKERCWPRGVKTKGPIRMSYEMDIPSSLITLPNEQPSPAQ